MDDVKTKEERRMAIAEANMDSFEAPHFLAGDLIVYRPSRRRYIVVRFYSIKHDGEKIFLLDIKPAEKCKGDKFRDFRGYNAACFDKVNRK